MNPIQELSEAAQVLLADEDGYFGLLGPSVAPLLLKCAERAHTQWLAWQHIPGGPEREMESVFAEELTVARVVLAKAGRAP